MRFPAIIQYVVTFYKHVLDQAVNDSNKMLSGYFAGGRLIVAFLWYLEENRKAVLPPSPRGTYSMVSMG